MFMLVSRSRPFGAGPINGRGTGRRTRSLPRARWPESPGPESESPHRGCGRPPTPRPCRSVRRRWRRRALPVLRECFRRFPRVLVVSYYFLLVVSSTPSAGTTVRSSKVLIVRVVSRFVVRNEERTVRVQEHKDPRLH